MRFTRLVSAILSILAVMVCAATATAQRSVPGIEIEVGNCSFMPTLYNGAVETILALRTDSPDGTNITSMWFIKGANDTWTYYGWTEQNQQKTVGYVKTALQIPGTDDVNWRVTPVAVNPNDLPPGSMRGGLFVDDPMADAVASSADPDQVLNLLVLIGWTAARSAATASACPHIVPILEQAFNAELATPGSGMDTYLSGLNGNNCQGGGAGSTPCQFAISSSVLSPITCQRTSAWTLTSIDMAASGSACCPRNHWYALFAYQQSKVVTYVCPD